MTARKTTISPLLLAILCCLFTSCSPSATTKQEKTTDPTTEPWYTAATQELAAVSRAAKTAYAAGKPDQASTLIQQGETIAARLLGVPRPTLAAAESASDLDDLYGRMLFGNRHYGWARLQFQKNLARWKHWTPKTDAAAVRLAAAQKAIAECDRKIDAP